MSLDLDWRYRADLIVERTLIVEVKTGPTLDPQAIPQLLNYLTVTKLLLGLVLLFGRDACIAAPLPIIGSSGATPTSCSH